MVEVVIDVEFSEFSNAGGGSGGELGRLTSCAQGIGELGGVLIGDGLEGLRYSLGIGPGFLLLIGRAARFPTSEAAARFRLLEGTFISITSASSTVMRLSILNGLPKNENFFDNKTDLTRSKVTNVKCNSPLHYFNGLHK